MRSHGEVDRILDRQQRSSIATLVERSTRYAMLIDLFDGRLAHRVSDAVAAKITDLPERLARSLTWDYGKQMAEHVRSASPFTMAPADLKASLREQREVH